MNFRLCLLVVALISMASAVKAQDTLLLKNGKRVASKIFEVTTSEVRYKKTENPDGPVFVISTADLDFIKYRNGSLDTIKTAAVPVPSTDDKTTVASRMEQNQTLDLHPPISREGIFYQYKYRRIKKPEMYDIIGSVHDPEIDLYIKRAKSEAGLRYIGFIAIPAITFAAGNTIVAFVGGGEKYGPGGIAALIAVATYATSITFTILEKNNRKEAIRIYNTKY